MKKTLILTFGVVVALAGCKQNTIVAGGEPPDDFNATAEGNFVLPAAIAASKTYRCADNTIVHVDWLSDGKSANIRVGDATSPTQVTGAETGKPMSGPAGYSLSGTAGAGSAKIGLPGKSAQSCQS